MTKYNWDNVPEGFKWVARNRDEVLWAFAHRPEIDRARGEWIDGMPAVRLGVANYCLIHDNWTDSLEERPKGSRYQIDTGIGLLRIIDTRTDQPLSGNQIVDLLNEHEERE